MNSPNAYRSLIQSLSKKYGGRLKTAVLFGSQARREARRRSDHDVFVVIEDLPREPLARLLDVRGTLLDILEDLPGSISFVAKTPEEMKVNLTPLMLDICVDGVCLYGDVFFGEYQRKALAALKKSGLERRLLGGSWMWLFPKLPTREWELNWEGYFERHG